ncbi:MAG: oligoendopeptidase F [Sphaerochaetaceae bacterium]
MEIKKRAEVAKSDQWDLSSLFASTQDWEKALERLGDYIKEAPSYKGKLTAGKQDFLDTFAWYEKVSILAEALANWAMLNYSADASDSENVRRYSLISQAYSQLGASLSFFDPELLSIDDATFDSYLKDNDFKPYWVYLAKERRFKAHVLSEKEERILALQSESAQTSSLTFQDLTNVDFDFGRVGDKPLTQSTLASFLINEDRNIRKEAYDQFYHVFESHQHTLARLYEGSVKQDIFSCTVRGFSSCRAKALYPDNVEEQVYDNLVETVHSGFDSLHRFYGLKRRLLHVDKLGHWDVYMPLVRGVTYKTNYEDAVDTVCKALTPLGDDYVRTIKQGLTNEHWVDRYENKGKRSGAFSSGCFTGKPYIMLNFTGETLGDLFTMIHEGGHSMHSFYSKKSNPYFQYDYTIFEAEVASTFNEQLLSHYLFNTAQDKQMRAYILGKQLDDIVATLFRQTMFAEYEDQVHKAAETGNPLTVDFLREMYRKLLDSYFGPDVQFESFSDLEGLRIPHFYNAYYVYKYATGISAAIALSQRVLNGGEKEKQEYLSFLHSGGSHFPMDSLRLAGVDMSKGEAVKSAIQQFTNLLNKFEALVL